MWRVWRNFDYFLIFVVAILVVMPILYCNLFDPAGVVFVGNDHQFHYSRAHSSTVGILDGQFVPQLDPDAFFGFGYAFNEFYGPLPTYFIAFINLFCGSFTGSVAIYELFAVFLLGVVVYNLTNRHLVRSQVRRFNVPCLFAVAVVFASSLLPYTVYDHIGYGSLTAALFFILLIDGLLRLLKREGGVFLIAISGAGMILTHTLTAFFAVVFGLLFLLLNIKKVVNKYVLARIGIALLAIVGLSAYFLLPLGENALSEAYNMNEPIFNKVYWWHTAEKMNEWRRDIFAGDLIMPSIIFILLIAMLIVSLIWRKRGKNLYTDGVIPLIIIGVLSFLLMTKLVDWEYMPSVFWTLQFVGRFRVPFAIFSSLAIIFFSTRFILKAKFSRFSFVLLFLIIVAIFDNVTTFNEMMERFSSSKHPFTEQSYAIDMDDDAESAAAFEYGPVKTSACRMSREEIARENQGSVAITYQAQSCLEARGNAVKATRGDVAVQVEEQRGSHFHLQLVHAENQSAPKSEANSNDAQKNAAAENQNASKSEASELGANSDNASKNRADNAREENSDIVVEMPKLYYPGYKAYGQQNGERVDFEVSESDAGLVQVRITPGYQGDVFVYFGMSTATQIGTAITLATILAGAVYFGRRRIGAFIRKVIHVCRKYAKSPPTRT